MKNLNVILVVAPILFTACEVASQYYYVPAQNVPQVSQKLLEAKNMLDFTYDVLLYFRFTTLDMGLHTMANNSPFSMLISKLE